MTEKKKSQTGTILVSAGWLLGLGAIAMGTAPSHDTNSVYLPATVETARNVLAHDADTVPDETSVDFIVRFHADDDVDACLEKFKTDPEGARIDFEGWASNHAELDGMKLKKTSYAGEMILSWTTEGGNRPNRADIITKQQALQAMPAVKYADPDYTAHAGETP